MVEMILLTGLLATTAVLVKNLVIGGPGTIVWDTLYYFEQQIDTSVSTTKEKASAGGKPSWNYYYLNKSPTVDVQ